MKEIDFQEWKNSYGRDGTGRDRTPPVEPELEDAQIAKGYRQ
jgi:hypothetical protein